MNTYIGIDPGENNGIAILEGNKITLKCLDFWSCIDLIECEAMQAIWNPEKNSELTFIVEDPNLNKPLFFRSKTNERGRTRIAQNVGSNKRDAKLIILKIFKYVEKCQRIKIKIIRPYQSKWKKEFFEAAIAQYQVTGANNEHTRDAVRLILGR